MERWYFMPNYECVRVSDDAMAMEMVGEGVKLVGEAEVVGKDGQRSAAKRGNNCIDLAVAAAFIRDQDYYGLAKWQPTVFYDESAYPVQTFNAPKQVASVVNSMWKGSMLVTPIGGGVQMRPTEAISPTNLLEDEEQAVAKARTETDLSHLAPDQWWWD
jgi:hypothetical protein